MPLLVSLIGGAVVVAFAVLSATMNWSYGVSRGTSELDQWLLGAVSVSADVYKAIGLFFVGWALKNRRLVTWGIAALAWGLCVVYGFTSAFGYASLTRADAARRGEDRGLTYASTKAELARKEQRRAQIGVVEAVGVIDARLVPLKATAIWKETRECRAPRYPEQVEHCDKIRKLVQDKAAAEEAERLDGEITSVRSQLAAFSRGTVTGDPQGDLMARLTGIELRRISTGLVVLLVVLVEVMSSAGLYIAFGHGEPLLWKHVDAGDEPTPPMGDVARFALAATREAPGTETNIDALFAGYRAWCASERLTSLTRDDFTASWQALANEVGWRIEVGRVCDLVLESVQPDDLRRQQTVW